MVGFAERTIYNIKKAVMNLFANRPSIDGIFDLNHRLSLIELYLNDRPSYAFSHQYIGPNVFEIASLRHSQAPGPPLVSDLAIPQGEDI